MMHTQRGSQQGQAWRRRAPGSRPEPAAEGLTIGQLARRTGVVAKTIRYYEAIGLLPPAARGENRYRRYGLADVNRLLVLRHIRLLGVPLAASRSLLSAASDARCAEVRDELQALVDARLHALDQEIAELRSLRDKVDRYSRALADCHPGDGELFRLCRDMRCIADSPGDGASEEDCCV
ncbi:MAG TPA: MerR family transcriptional regulator [Ktedonobacterales bacterium]